VPPSRRHDKSVYVRRRIAVVAILAVLVGIGTYSGIALTRPVPAAAAALSVPATVSNPAVPLAWPQSGHNGAIGAIGFDGVLADYGPQETTPMASITKTVTALVTLEAKPIAAGDTGPGIPLTVADQRIYQQVIAEGGSAAPVVPGAVFTQRQILEAMMLPSANNYSITLVNWAFGSMDAYLEAARAWLAEHGLNGTTIADSSGLNPGSASTPADLVTIGKLVLQNPVLKEIVAEQQAELPVIGTVHNTNLLLGQDGVIGLKTGTTDIAGACLLFAAELPVGASTVTVVGVVLGAPNHRVLAEEVTALLGTVGQAFHEVTPVAAGQDFGSYSSVWGDSASVVARESATVITWQDQPVTVKATADAIASGTDGEQVGTATISYNGGQQSVPLTLNGTIAEPDPFWRLTNPVG